MTKINRAQLRALREFRERADAAGRVALGDWTSGRGRFTKPRAMPPFVRRVERDAFRRWDDTDAPRHGTPERAAWDFLREQPRRRAVYVLDRAAFETWAWDALAGAELPEVVR